MSAYGSYTNAGDAGSGAYSTPFGPGVDRVLQAEPEEVAQGLVVPDMSIHEGFDQMAGSQADDERWQDILRDVSSRPLQGDEVSWEKADSHHRVGKLLQACWQVYQAQGGLAAAKSAGFFQWLDAMPEMRRINMIADAIKLQGAIVHGTVAEQDACRRAEAQLKAGGKVDERPNLRPSMVKAFVKGVAYLDAVTRRNYQVTFEQGVAKYRGANFDTNAMRTVFSGSGVAIWVMDENGCMYAGSHVYGELHHSSFLSGESIKAGGEIRAKNGMITFMSGKSGHYKPPIDNLVAAVKVLKELSPHMNPQILVFRDGHPLLISVGELLAHHSLYLSWGNITEEFRFNLQQQFAQEHQVVSAV